MLLFSTVLDINSTMTKEAFIELVIEWNQGSPHSDNVIPGIEWDGKLTACYEYENLRLDIQEYRNQNIIAVRYEKKDSDAVIWNTDYIMNFNTMKMAVRLDRSYLEEALAIDLKFSTPHFITLLIKRGYLKEDGKLPILRTPFYIDETNYQLLADVVNGKERYRLPVVYISKTFCDENPVDVDRLAGRLKGVAHVLVQKTNCSNRIIREMCESKNEYYGAIGIYYPNQAIKPKRYLYRSSVGIDSIMSEKVIRSVIQYSNSQKIDALCTWQGVNNALLLDRLESQREERIQAETERKHAWEELFALKSSLDETKETMQQEALEKAKNETDVLLESFEDDMQRLRDEVERLNKCVEKLEYENQGLRTKVDLNTEIPLLIMGDEDEFYPGEIKDLILSTLQKGLDGIEPKTRRFDVVNDIIMANDYQAISEKKAAEVKRILKNYSGMTTKLRRQLEEIGFQIEMDGPHYKARYYGDDRYIVIYGKTPSDGRAGKNNADVTIKKAF